MSDTDSKYQDREQSEIKHHALRLYLEAATRILGSTRNVRYVDCCAGPWNACSPDYIDTSFGIAVSVLRQTAEDLRQRGLSPQFAALLIEKKLTAFARLKAFAEAVDTPSLRVHAGNYDFTERLSEIARYCAAPGTFPFIFIDPTGWQLAGISKIRPLIQLNPGEVLINLMSPFIARFIMDRTTDFSDLLGSDFPSLRKLSGPELEAAIVSKYCELVKREGKYNYVCSLPVMNPDMDSFNFHLVYATRHWKGVRVFKDVERRTEEKTHVIRAELQQKARQLKSGNGELFGAEVQYRENCYQRLTRTNKEKAKAAVHSLLHSAPQVSYDLCWGEALQFSAVYEADIRDWLTVWEREGLVTIKGKAPNARVLQVGKGLMVSRIVS